VEALNPICRAALQVQDWLLARGWRFRLNGGVAIRRWAEPRLTRDVDLTLLPGFGGEGAFADALRSRFLPRNPNAQAHALRHRVLPLTCGLENLIVHKIFARRDRDRDDLQSVPRRQRAQHDVALVQQEVIPLLEPEGSPEAWDRFEQLSAKVRRQLNVQI
jgi:hypothetical protein